MAFWFGIAYHLASRLAYVVWVGVALGKQRRRQQATPDKIFGADFERFRKRASLLMANDAASFVLLCLLTRGHPPDPMARWIVGTLLIATGVGSKAWAAKSLGRNAYYWHNFFAPPSPAPRPSPGPYRYIQNPMYTVGYLQVYGLALVSGSLAGLIAAGFDQVAILAFHHQVERPHYEGVVTAGSSVPASPSRVP